MRPPCCVTEALYPPFIWSSLSSRRSSVHSAAITMKRRNALLDGKPRRPVKRQNKIADNIYGSTLVYVKLLLLWALVLLADHFLEFRFEYLWPLWLFLRSVYDSYKYQGLAFSVFFVCIAVTSDMICFLFIPVHWLFFAASTYVWVQYVWHTEKGICLPTVFLWLLFVYIEASIRLKEFKAQIDLRNLPFHLDLCRPFAAHCIGYPVVTLGFGFKTYVGYRMRQRRQKEVQKVNEFYYEFLREALPPGPVRDEAFNPHPSPALEDRISDGAAVISPLNNAVSAAGVQGSQGLSPSPASNSSPNGSLGSAAALISSSTSTSSQSGGGGGSSAVSVLSDAAARSMMNNNDHCVNGVPSSAGSAAAAFATSFAADLPHNKLTSLSRLITNGVSSASHSASCSSNIQSNGELLDYLEKVKDDATVAAGGGGGDDNVPSPGSGSGGRSSSKKWSSASAGSSGGHRDSSRKNNKEKILTKEEQMAKMESDLKRLKVDLQISRNKENDLRQQIVSSMSNERSLKSEISNLQVEKSIFEGRVSNLVSTRASEKASMNALEKKLAEERKHKTEFQMKLESERKTKKEAANAERAAHQSQTRSEVSKLEAEIKSVKAEMQAAKERCQVVENEAYMLRKLLDQHGDPQVLKENLSIMKDKNLEIERSLSSETKIKMDLFSALGDAQREISIKSHELSMSQKLVAELRLQIAEFLAVMPPTGATRGSATKCGLNGSASNDSSNSAVVGLANYAAANAVPRTLSLDLPLATELSSFNGNSKMQTGLGLANLEDQLMTGDSGSLFKSSSFSRANGSTD